MSYILDALRKSEAERRQGKAPDLGHQVQMVYRPKKKRVPAVVWIVVLALLVNAGVMAYVFWPETGPVAAAMQAEPAPAQPVPTEQSVADAPKAKPEPEPVATVQPEPAPAPAVPIPDVPEAHSGTEELWAEPVVIVPSQSKSNPGLTQPQPEGRVPHLVELPLSFQKSVPDLTFNSHIYSSDPPASRVMINNRYLRTGDRFEQLTIERITEDGVVLSKNGQYFRVGTVRDWVSPR